MAAVEHEGWAKTGDRLVVVSDRGTRPFAAVCDVTRTTKTQIELSTGAKLRWDGRQYVTPGRGLWDLSPTLYRLDDERVPGILRDQRIRNVRANLKKAVTEFDTNTGTSEEAALIQRMAGRLAELVAEAGR